MRQSAPEFFQHPDALHVGQFNVDQADVHHAANEQRFGFLQVDPMDEPELFRIERSPNGIGQIRMRGQD